MTSHNGKLIFINAPTRDSEKAQRFYADLLGGPFAHVFNPNVAGWWTPLQAGINFNITVRYDDREAITPYFAVDNLDSAIAELEKLGGRVVVKPRDVVLGPAEAQKFYEEHLRRQNIAHGTGPIKSLGRMAVMLDPDLSHVGLMQVAPYAHRFFGLGTAETAPASTAAAATEFSATRDLADKLVEAGALPRI